ncbi:MAG: glycosyltransferase, partial [Armatimonadetes bacterium]|nr:glycosyltransferase [Armatimonadota bacterium]
PGRTGWLAPARSSAGLAEIITSALGDSGLSAMMAEAARTRILREHTRERMLEQLAEIYERAVEERRS